MFSALFLDSQHRVVRFEELCRGKIDSVRVFTREVVNTAGSCGWWKEWLRIIGRKGQSVSSGFVT